MSHVQAVAGMYGVTHLAFYGGVRRGRDGFERVRALCGKAIEDPIWLGEIEPGCEACAERERTRVEVGALGR